MSSGVCYFREPVAECEHMVTAADTQKKRRRINSRRCENKRLAGLAALSGVRHLAAVVMGGRQTPKLTVTLLFLLHRSGVGFTDCLMVRESYFCVSVCGVLNCV